MDTIGGLVAHPLLVHVPVVLVPLAAVGVVAMALRPAWQQRFAAVVTALAGVGAVGAVAASRSGEALEERFEASGQTVSGTLERHAEMGESAPLVVIAFVVVLLAWTLFAAWRRRVGEERAVAVAKRPRVVGAALCAVSVLVGVLAAVAVVRTGHSGAESVWEDAADTVDASTAWMEE